MKQIEMKQKFLVIMLMLTVGLTACSLDDEESDGRKYKTETWDVTIEPEYILGRSYGGYYPSFNMEARFEDGRYKGSIAPSEIAGFTFEEGYRYKLKIEAKSPDPMVYDGPGYTYKLKELLSKEYVGISTEGRRDVTMDVRTVRMLPPDGDSSQGFYYLCGKTRDGSEKIDMGFQEIYGMDYNQFFESAMRTESDVSERYSCYVQLSITPCERPIFDNHQYRIRMEHMLGQSRLAGDSIVVASTKEEYNTKYYEFN